MVYWLLLEPAMHSIPANEHDPMDVQCSTAQHSGHAIHPSLTIHLDAYKMAVAVPAWSANCREERDKIKISIYQLRRDWTGRVPTGRWMQVSCH